MKNRKSLLIILLVFLFSLCFAYENSMLNLVVPTSLEKGNLELSIRHRFYGAIDDEPIDSFFGMDKGANINLGLRFPIITNLETYLNYVRLNNEYNFGISFKTPIPKLFLNYQFHLEYFTFEKFGISERRNNFFYQVSLQSNPLINLFSPAFNIAYDGYYDRIGLAAGMNIQIFEDWSLIAEFYPVLNKDKNPDGKIPLGEKNFFTFGIKYQTYAHHFMFMISNGSQIGNRNLMLGTPSNDLFFGFNIQRKLYL